MAEKPLPEVFRSIAEDPFLSTLIDGFGYRPAIADQMADLERHGYTLTKFLYYPRAIEARRESREGKKKIFSARTLYPHLPFYAEREYRVEDDRGNHSRTITHTFRYSNDIEHYPQPKEMPQIEVLRKAILNPTGSKHTYMVQLGSAENPRLFQAVYDERGRIEEIALPINQDMAPTPFRHFVKFEEKKPILVYTRSNRQDTIQRQSENNIFNLSLHRQQLIVQEDRSQKNVLYIGICPWNRYQQLTDMQIQSQINTHRVDNLLGGSLIDERNPFQNTVSGCAQLHVARFGVKIGN
jgi:hypothetical protein